MSESGDNGEAGPVLAVVAVEGGRVGGNGDLDLPPDIGSLPVRFRGFTGGGSWGGVD